jgi:hypothetical protein
MKKLRILVLLLLITVSFGYSQSSMKDLFSGKTKLTFLGFDFTQARFIGSVSFTDAKSIRDYFMEEWNKLIFLEPQKFSLQNRLKLSPDNYTSDTDCLMELNKTIDMKGKVIDVPYELSMEDAKRSVANYKCNLKEGIACSFVIECFSKLDEKASAWVIFFDAGTKNILLAEKIEGKVGGFGLRNYYAAGLYKIMLKIEKDYYKKWLADAK